MKLHAFKSKYKKEYNAIYKELDPKCWKKLQKQEKIDAREESEEERKWDEEEKAEEERDRREWARAGGER